MTGHPLAPSVQLPLLPSGPGGVHGLQSRGPGHHTIRRNTTICGQCGGRSGIRTHGTLPHTRFPSERLRPLGHPSCSHFKPTVFSLKSGEGGIRTHGGREPTVDFESTAFVHSATSPHSFLRFFRLSRKKALRSSELSSASTPPVTSNR